MKLQSENSEAFERETTLRANTEKHLNEIEHLNQEVPLPLSSPLSSSSLSASPLRPYPPDSETWRSEGERDPASDGRAVTETP